MSVKRKIIKNKNKKTTLNVVTSYGFFYPGTCIRNPERNKDLVRLFSTVADEYLSDELAVELYDAGIEQDLWESEKIQTNSDKIKKIRQIISELSTRAFVFLTDHNQIKLGSFKAILDDNTNISELTIKYLIGLWFPNPSTNAYLNKCNLFYLILRVIEEINNRIGPNEKQGIYREELFYILIAKDNDYMAIADMIMEKRKKYSKCKKPLHQMLEGIDVYEYPQLRNNQGEFIKKDTIRSYTDVMARNLNMTDLFEIHGFSNPLINFSKYTTQKIQMLIQAFKNGEYDQNFDSFVYTAVDKKEELFPKENGLDAYNYWENIYKIKLPWEEDDDFYSEQEMHLFGKTYKEDAFVIRKERIENQLQINKRIAFFDLLENKYNTNIYEVLYNPDKWAEIWSLEYLDERNQIERTAVFEGCVGLLVWYLTKDIPGVSVIINTKLDDNGIPTGWATGSHLNSTGEDFRIVLSDGFINGEPSLTKGRLQANQECGPCIDHIVNVIEKTNIQRNSSMLIVPHVDMSTIERCYKRKSDLILIPMSIGYLSKIGNEWKKSKNCNYLLNKLEELHTKDFRNEKEFYDEMNQPLYIDYD